jgi:hypothetical protein
MQDRFDARGAAPLAGVAAPGAAPVYTRGITLLLLINQPPRSKFYALRERERASTSVHMIHYTIGHPRPSLSAHTVDSSRANGVATGESLRGELVGDLTVARSEHVDLRAA